MDTDGQSGSVFPRDPLKTASRTSPHWTDGKGDREGGRHLSADGRSGLVRRDMVHPSIGTRGDFEDPLYTLNIRIEKSHNGYCCALYTLTFEKMSHNSGYYCTLCTLHYEVCLQQCSVLCGTEK